MWIDLLEGACLVLGVFFMFVASLGVFRLRDFYLRIHAPTKAATLGLALLLAAAALHLGERSVATKAVLALLFIGATAPVGGHILARAAYRNGVPPTPGTSPDEYAPLVRGRRETPGAEPRCADDVAPADTLPG
ncbi:MAG: monovalent cation/H(+) antiporter subunit G [Gemmatimonadota bacterium]